MSKTIVIPTNPADIARIKTSVKAASDCMIRISAEKDEMKAIAELMYEELELPKKYFHKMVKVYHKASFDKEVQDGADFQELYEAVIAK